MLAALCAGSMAFAWLRFLSPRMFLYFDRQCTMKRFAPTDFATQSPQPQRVSTKTTNSPDDIALCEALSRETRSGVVAHDALMRLQPSYCSMVFDSAPYKDAPLIVQLLRSSVIDGYFIPAALDHAAHILREERHATSAARVATSQARITIRILSWLPIAVLAFGFVVQPDIRRQIFSPPMIYCVAFGLLFNFAGRAWSQHLLKKSLHLTESPALELGRQICVSMRAGCSITEACTRSAQCNEVGAAVAKHIENNETLAHSLQPLREGNGAVGVALANTLLQASIDGLPVLTTIHQLSVETRTEHRRLIDSRIQELPVRLTFPTVLLILPSFFLLGVAPFVVAQLHNMSLPFSPAT